MQAECHTDAKAVDNGAFPSGSPHLQRFVMVLEGEILIAQPGKGIITLSSNDFAFFPSDSQYKITSTTSAGLLVFERLLDSATVAALGKQGVLTGNIDSQPLLDTGVTAPARTVCAVHSSQVADEQRKNQASNTPLIYSATLQR